MREAHVRMRGAISVPTATVAGRAGAAPGPFWTARTWLANAGRRGAFLGRRPLIGASRRVDGLCARSTFDRHRPASVIVKSMVTRERVIGGQEITREPVIGGPGQELVDGLS